VKTFKKIAFRIIVLSALLMLMQIIYVRFFLEDDLQKHSPIVNDIRAIENESTVLYLGESSNVTYSEADRNKNSISDMLNGLLENEKVADITKPAAHLGIYRTILENVASESKIKTVVLTVNLRSFAADWVFSELETPLQKEMMLLQNRPAFFNRFLLSFRAYGTTNERKRFEKMNDWWEREFLLIRNKKRTTVRDWQLEIDKNWIGSDIKKRDLAKNYMNNFAFTLDIDHPRIKDLDAIIELAKQKGWNLVLNLLPENLDSMKELVGDDLIVLAKQNARFITQRYEKKNIPIVNNLVAVRGSNFVDKVYPTEHYNESGRMMIAKNLADAINLTNVTH